MGPDAPYLPIEEKLHHGRGHRSNHSPQAIAELEALLNGEWAELLDIPEKRGTFAVPDEQPCDCGCGNSGIHTHKRCSGEGCAT